MDAYASASAVDRPGFPIDEVRADGMYKSGGRRNVGLAGARLDMEEDEPGLALCHCVSLSPHTKPQL